MNTRRRALLVGLSAFALVAPFAAPAKAQTLLPRQRIWESTNQTVYIDPNGGLDTNGGTSPTDAVKTLQHAFDIAAGNFDLGPPYSWSRIGTGSPGYRPGVTIQAINCPQSSPIYLPNPVYLDGLASPHPIYLRGDPSNPGNCSIYANNSWQGLTAQRGGELIVDGFFLRGDTNCTLINGLELGKIGIRNCWFGQGNTGAVGAIGAAGGAIVDVIGPITLVGSGFNTVFTVIEGGKITLGLNGAIVIGNAMNFGIMCNASLFGQIASEGTAPTWTGPGGGPLPSGLTGQSYNAVWHGIISFSGASIPGSAGYCDASSLVL